MSAESDRVTLVGPDIFTEGESYKNARKYCKRLHPRPRSVAETPP